MKWRIALAALFVFSLWQTGFFDLSRLSKIANLSPFLSRMFPPDLSILLPVLSAMYETILMAIAGTMIGGAVSLALAALSARQVSPRPVRTFFRALLALVRTVPAILWALIFVVIVGFGPLAGVLALSLYTVGYLGKLFYESFDSVSSEVLEAVKSVGSTRIQQLRYAIIPESANYLISQTLFIFEYNVRASSIVGLVGAGGIGYLIIAQVQSLQYSGLLTTILVLLCFVLGLDALSSRIRARFFA